jgi:hypothetical protein
MSKTNLHSLVYILRINGILKDEFLIHKCNTGKELDKLIAESIETYNNDRTSFKLKHENTKFYPQKNL